MASKYLHKYKVPENFQQVLHTLIKFILKDQPRDIVHYSAMYFDALNQNKNFKYNPHYQFPEDKPKQPEKEEVVLEGDIKEYEAVSSMIGKKFKAKKQIEQLKKEKQQQLEQQQQKEQDQEVEQQQQEEETQQPQEKSIHQSIERKDISVEHHTPDDKKHKKVVEEQEEKQIEQQQHHQQYQQQQQHQQQQTEEEEQEEEQQQQQQEEEEQDEQEQDEQELDEQEQDEQEQDEQEQDEQEQYEQQLQQEQEQELENEQDQQQYLQENQDQDQEGMDEEQMQAYNEERANDMQRQLDDYFDMENQQDNSQMQQADMADIVQGSLQIRIVKGVNLCLPDEEEIVTSCEITISNQPQAQLATNQVECTPEYPAFWDEEGLLDMALPLEQLGDTQLEIKVFAQDDLRAITQINLQPVFENIGEWSNQYFPLQKIQQADEQDQAAIYLQFRWIQLGIEVDDEVPEVVEEQ